MSVSSLGQRQLTLVVAVVLVAAVFVPTIAFSTARAQAGAGYPALADDFEARALGALTGQGGWTEVLVQTPQYFVAADGENQYATSPPSKGFSSTHVYERALPRLEGSVRVKLNSSLASEVSAGFFLQDSGYETVSPGFASAYVFLGPAAKVYARDPTLRVPRELASYQPNTWVTVDLDFHKEGTFDVCVDGYPVAKGLPFSAAPMKGLDTLALTAGESFDRQSTARWDDVVLSLTPQDFCLDDVGYEGAQNIWDFQGVGAMVSDRQYRMQAVALFEECTIEAPQMKMSACPKSVAEFEADLRKTLDDSPLARTSTPPKLVSAQPVSTTFARAPTPTLAPVATVGRNVPDRGQGPEFPVADCCNPVPQAGPELPAVPRPEILAGPEFPGPLTPRFVAGPELPPVPAVELLAPPAPPAPVEVPTVPGPAFPEPVAMSVDLVDCPACPELPALESENVVVPKVSVPVSPVVVPVRDHPIEMDWSVSMSAQKLIDMVLPGLPAPIDGAIPPVPFAGPVLLDGTPRAAPAVGTPEFEGWMKEHGDLIDYLAEAGAPELRVPEARPPVLYEIHTESRNVTKRSLGVPFIPTIIDVDDNPTTGLLGFDVLVLITTNLVINEMVMNVTRLMPIERNMPGLGEQLPQEIQDLFPGGPFPGAPLDLTLYVLAPLTLLMPVETALAQNPDEVQVAAVGYTTQGKDAPFSAQLALKADSLLPPHPNTRYELSFSTWEALDDFTLLGGIATEKKVGPDEQDLTDLLGLLGLSAPAPSTFPAPFDGIYQAVLNSTAFRIGYEYQADAAQLATVAFQPTPQALHLDLILDDDEDANQVIRLESEVDTDLSVVFSEERNLLTSPELDLVNLRADKLPREIVVTIHDDPGLPALDVTYTASQGLGRLEAIRATNVVLDAEEGAPGTPVLTEFGEGRAVGVFHLNASDLPAFIDFRLENGSDVQFTAGGPIGRVAVVSSENATPALVQGSDGVFAEILDDSMRFGAALRGLQALKLVTSEPTMVLRWAMVGDQPFRVNVTRGEDVILGAISNLPPTLGLATDSATFVELDAQDGIRDLALYLASGGLEARVDVAGIPATLDARFDLDGGTMSLDAGTAFRSVDVVARSATEFAAGLSAIRLHAGDIPSFEASWDTTSGAPAFTFDAGPEGIGVLDFQGGGAEFRTLPDARDHAVYVESAEGTFIDALITGLKHVEVAMSEESYAFRVEHKLPEFFRLVVDRPGLTLQGEIDRVPAVVDVRASIADGNIGAVYEASEVIDRLFLCGALGSIESYVTLTDIPARVSFDVDTAASTSEWRASGRLGSVSAFFRDATSPEGILGTGFERVTFLLRDMPSVLRATFEPEHIVVDSLGEPLGLAALAIHDGDAAPFLDGLGIYLVETATAEFPRGFSARIPGFLSATLDTTDAIDARLSLASGTPVRLLHIGSILGAPADVRLEMLDLPADVHVRVDETTFSYDASGVITSIVGSADFEDFSARVTARELPERVQGTLQPAGSLEITTSGVLREFTVDARSDTGLMGTEWKRARASVRDLPAQIYATFGASGATLDTGGDAIGEVTLHASGTQDLTDVPGDHALLAMAGPAGPIPAPAGPLVSARITGLSGASFEMGATGVALSVERTSSAVFHALAALPSESLWAAARVDELPASFAFKTDMTSDFVWEASSVIRAIDATLALGSTIVDLRLVDLPARVALSLEADGGATRAYLSTSSVLQSILVDARDPAGLLGTDWGRVRAAVGRVPAEAEVVVDATGARFRAFDNALGLAEAHVARVGAALIDAKGDHAILVGAADGTLYQASARITDLRELSFAIDADGLDAVIAKDAPAPFTGYVDWPAEGILAVLRIADVPARIHVESDLESYHLYEASGPIAAIDAYASTPDLAGWLSIDDLPARIRVDVAAAGDAISADYVASGRVREIRADVYAAGGLFGTPIARAYAFVQDLPEALSFDMEGESFAFEANPTGIGLLEAAVSSTSALTMLAGNHALFMGDPATGFEASGRLTGLREASVAVGSAIVGEDRLAARLDTSDPAPFTAYAKLPSLALEAALVVDRLPAVIDVRSNLKDRHTFEASSVIDRLALHATLGTLEAHLEALLIPARIDVLLEGTGSDVKTTVLSQGRLGSLALHAQDGAGILGTPFARAYARVVGVPEEVVLDLDVDGFSFRAEPGSIDLVEAMASVDFALSTLAGDHALLLGGVDGPLGQVSARLTGLVAAEAHFGEGGFDARLETDRADPFLAHAELPHLDLDATVAINDLPALVSIDSNLVDRHLYEASSVISRLDAYARYGTLQGWIGIEDLPARLKVLVNATAEGMEAFVLASSRTQEIRADLYDSAGILGTPFTRAYAKVVGIPSVLTFTFTGTAAEFGTEHDMIALLEGAISSTDSLLMLEGDHVFVGELRDPKCGIRDGEQTFCPTAQYLSFRLHGLEGARGAFAPDNLYARLETKDERPFLAFVVKPDLRACLYIENLPLVVEFKSNLANDHRYDASSVIEKLQLSAQVQTLDLFLEMRDLPSHIHVQNNATADGTTVRMWTDTILRDVVLDARDPNGLFGSEFKRVRGHVKDLPRQLELDVDATGAEFGTGWEQIGLVEAWASTSLALTDIAGDHVRFTSACDEKLGGCAKDVSARITGLVSARVAFDAADGLHARLETKDPRVFRVLYADDSDGTPMSATLVMDEKPAVLSFTSDLESRHIFEASGVTNTIALSMVDDTMTLLGLIQSLPARMELTTDITSTGGTAKIVTSSQLGLIGVDIRDPNGLQGEKWERVTAVVRDLPTMLAATFGDGEVRIVTDGQGIGLMTAGISTSSTLDSVTGNGFRYYKNGLDERATARLAGFTGAYFKEDAGVIDAELHLRDAAPFEAYAQDGANEAYALISPVPEDVTLHIDAPSSIVYSASRPIEKIVIWGKNATASGDRTLSATLTTLPATMRLSMDEETQIIHWESSEPIGKMELYVHDPMKEFDFEDAYAKITHVPSSMRVRLTDPIQLDLSEGVDEIEIGITSVGSYPSFAEPHASVRKESDGTYSASARLGALKFVEFASRNGFVLIEGKFRESQEFRARYTEENGGGGVEKEYDLYTTNIPKEFSINVIGGGETGSILYDASERIGAIDINVIDPAIEYASLTLSNLPSKLVIEWKFGTDDLPWFVRYVADAPTDIDFEMPTPLGPLTVDGTLQNFQWTLLDVPEVFPPDVSVEASIEWECFLIICVPIPKVKLAFTWDFTVATDTDFLPNNILVTLGLFRSADVDVSIYLEGRIMVQDWIYKPSITFAIELFPAPGLPSLSLGMPTVFGGGFASLCAGVDANIYGYHINECKQFGGIV